MSTIEEIQARRAARRAAAEDERAEQYALDLAELDALEEAHGYERIEPVHLIRWQKGAATMLIVKMPRASEHVYKRFQHEVHREGLTPAQKVEAEEMLARSCVVYPSPKGEQADLFKGTVDISPGILAQAAHLLVKGVQGRVADEGK